MIILTHISNESLVSFIFLFPEVFAVWIQTSADDTIIKLVVALTFSATVSTIIFTSTVIVIVVAIAIALPIWLFTVAFAFDLQLRVETLANLAVRFLKLVAIFAAAVTTVPIATAVIVCVVTTAVVSIFPVAAASVLWTLRS